MAEQPHPWGDRTLEVTPQDPWADPPTAAGPPSAPQAPSSAPPASTRQTSAPPAANPFQQGRASVNPASPRTEPFTAAHEPTGTGWPDTGAVQQRQSMSWHLGQLRRGGEWSSAAVLFAFVCWGIWAVSSSRHLTTPVLVFVVTLAVAVGLFGLSRLLGRLVLEKQFGRVRRTARGAHLVTAVFLVGVGFAYLRQTDWVMAAWRWVAGLFA
jgi:hypothetical protein